jgi:hypothetical protein
MKKKALSRVGMLTSLILLLTVLAMQATVLPTPALAQAATPLPTISSNTLLSIVPASTTLNPGDTFDIILQFDTDVPTWGLQLEVAFDPNLVEITSVQEGSFYKSWAVQNGVETVVIPSPVPDNTKGVIPQFAVIIVGAEPGSGPSGEGDLFVIKAKVKPDAAGEVEFKLSQVQVSDAGTYGKTTSEVGGVMLQNAVVAIGSDTPPQQPAPFLNPGTRPPAEGSSVEVQPTIERRVPTSEDSGDNGIPWEIYLPIAAVFIVGVVGYALTRRSSKAKTEKK